MWRRFQCSNDTPVRLNVERYLELSEHRFRENNPLSLTMSCRHPSWTFFLRRSIVEISSFSSLALTRSRLSVGKHGGIAAVEDRIDQWSSRTTVDQFSWHAFIERVVESRRWWIDSMSLSADHGLTWRIDCQDIWLDRLSSLGHERRNDSCSESSPHRYLSWRFHVYSMDVFERPHRCVNLFCRLLPADCHW